MWDLPRPGIKPVSPALVGAFLSTVSAAKSWCFRKSIFFAFFHLLNDGNLPLKNRFQWLLHLLEENLISMSLHCHSRWSLGQPQFSCCLLVIWLPSPALHGGDAAWPQGWRALRKPTGCCNCQQSDALGTSMEPYNLLLLTPHHLSRAGANDSPEPHQWLAQAPPSRDPCQKNQYTSSSHWA